MKSIGRYCFCLFHSHDPKPKWNHQIASSRAKSKSRWSHTCVKYMGNIICIKRNIYVNTSDLKYFTKNVQKRLNFQTLSSISPNIHLVCFNLRLDSKAMTFTVYLAPWYEGHSLSVQCYEFCLHAILFL